jgi:signal transduction histidine kinase
MHDALKFSDNGKRVWVDVRAGEGHVTCTVRDEGKGFSPDDMARLFQKGVRLSNSPTGGETTLGYGLAIAKDILEKLGGDIRCESRPGSGSSFHVRLPACKELS